MCGIVGILSKRGENVAPLIEKMLSCMKNRGPDGVGLATEDEIVYSNTFNKLFFSQTSAFNVLAHSRLAIVGGSCGSQPFLSCNKKLVLEHNGEIYNYRELRKSLESHHEFKTSTDSEVIIHLLEDHYEKTNGNLLEAVKRTVFQLDGIYILAIKEQSTGNIILVRDGIGVRQIYYGEDDRYFAFGSEKKALWKISLDGKIQRLLPGYALFISQRSEENSFTTSLHPVTVNTSKSIRSKYPISYKDIDSALNAYNNALIASVEKRVRDFSRIGIVFSGGIDSVIVAYLAKQMVPEVICYTSGIRGSNDITNSIEIAEKLDLRLEINELSQDDVERMIPNIINVIEDDNMGQVEVAIPIYAAVKLAREQGIRVMLTGQGADEIFGGYSWYSKIVQKYGYDKILEYMIKDVQLLYKETLEREDKITMSQSIELREPFLDPNLIDTVLRIDPRLNIQNDGVDAFDTLGKRVHRRLAEKIGIPKEIAYRIKEAAQHGSGIHNLLDSIARQNGFTESSVKDNYLDKLNKRELMGSSQRYGHLFESEKIWNIEPHIQMYLEKIAANILPSISKQ
ncbi:MAG: asparagine synthase (glutamine-hydrolyzing) [Candidatus Nitrosocosmicus sp.]|jgi:asparagine synthase (glutamine-hydrolysing)|uniref:asparagine synthase (glutamine-hydrolyzing) n=1 Tax=Candidatus Nitrosocosmicus sp. FF01 TaxID=3397670 RepID=UPI002A6EBDDD|nr:asparagine synthase (glutamine-hydrolyzing) [Candidatus Nitrosocosmicus sp.]GKS61511.1 asparagine synthase (glutamine-hydrolyzing) [Candidatus Nitrosocosmicus sp.]